MIWASERVSVVLYEEVKCKMHSLTNAITSPSLSALIHFGAIFFTADKYLYRE